MELKHAIGTGGGPPLLKLPKLSENMLKLASIIAKSVQGLPPRRGTEDFRPSTSVSALAQTENEDNQYQFVEIMDEEELDELNKAENEICAMGSVDEESPRIDSPVQAPLMQIEQIIDAHSMEADTNAKSVDDDPVPMKVEKKWSQWTPSSLRTKVSSPLKRKRVSNSVQASTTARSDLYELECYLVQEKHEMVMAQQKIEKSRASAVHTITIANMRAAARRDCTIKSLQFKKMCLEMEHSKEEHTLKMKILQQRLEQEKLEQEIRMASLRQELHCNMREPQADSTDSGTNSTDIVGPTQVVTRMNVAVVSSLLQIINNVYSYIYVYLFICRQRKMKAKTHQHKKNK